MSSNLAGLSSLIHSERLDIIFLQEVKLSGAEIESLLFGFRAVSNLDPSNPSKPGTAIVWRNTLPVEDVYSLSLCRLQVATLASYQLVNVYGPSGSDRKKEREHFYSRDVFLALQLASNKAHIIGGDFNAVLQPIDIENGIGFDHKKSVSLGDLVRVTNLQDVFRNKYPNSAEFTFHRPGCASSRLDRLYVSAAIVNDSQNVQHFPSLSDHFGVKIRISLEVSPIFIKKDFISSYWKLNCAILEENDFLPSFKAFWNTISKCTSSFSDIADWWDFHAKPSIREFCIAFSQDRMKRKKMF